MSEQNAQPQTQQVARYTPAQMQRLREDLLATRPTFEQIGLKSMDFNKELEFAIQAFTNNAYLLGSDANTVRNCLINVALSGLTLNPVMKLAYLVPRKQKCCVDPSYQGLIKIVTDSGSVTGIYARVVYENEPFQIERGTNGFVKHGICTGPTKGKRIGAYSVAELSNGSQHVEWMYEEELMLIRKRSESVKSGKASPWDSDEDEMVKKTVVKRHWKYLPKSERAQMAAQAIAFDDEANGIDFEAEKKQMDAQRQQSATPPNSTPNAPEEALATEEDVENIRNLCANQNLGKAFIEKSKNGGDILVANFLARIELKYAEGKLLKADAENFIKFLKKEITEAHKLNQKQ